MPTPQEILKQLNLALLQSGNWRYIGYPAAATGTRALTSDAAARTKGAYLGAAAEFVAASAITTAFWLASVYVDTAADAGGNVDETHYVDFATGAVGSEVNLLLDFYARSQEVTAVGVILAVPVFLNRLPKVAANGRLTGRTASVSADAGTINAAVGVLTHADLNI